MHSITKQRASAVLAALLVVALVASLLLLIQVTHRASINRASNLIAYEKAYTFAQGIEEWAIGRLLDYQSLPNDARVKQTWPIRLEARTEEGNRVSGEIIDQQSFFNMNSLGEDNNVTGLTQILNGIVGNEAKSIAQRIANEVDARTEVRGDASLQMRFVSELRAVHGISDTQLRTLAQSVAFYPQPLNNLNINTAGFTALFSAFANANPDRIKMIIDLRAENGPFQKVSDINAFIQTQGKSGLMTNLVTTSNYFLVHAKVQRQEIDFDQYSLVFVRTEQDKIKGSVLWRSQTNW